MKRILGLCLVLVLLFASVSVNAGYFVYPEGMIENKIVFHNQSGWYIYNGQWFCNTVCGYGENGRFYVPVNYLKELLGFEEAFLTADGKGVYAKLGDISLWQVVGANAVSVNGVWYDDAAPYIAPDGTAMVALDLYTYPVGYTFTAETPDDYKNGIVTVTSAGPVNYSRVEVNKEMQLVTVFGKNSAGAEVPVWYGVCSTGMEGQETVEGRYYLRPLSMSPSYGNWYLFASSGIWIVNCTQIWGDFCFHSVLFRNLFNPGSLVPSSFYDLGKKATNGCVRMTVEDTGFIYQNCGGLPCDIGPGYYSDYLAEIKAELMEKLAPTAEDYIKEIGG